MADHDKDIAAMLRWCDYSKSHSWHAALTALVAERNALRQRVAELEAHPPADRDLRERLLESALQGSGCRLGIMKESDAEELGRQAAWIVNGALAAMRKGVGMSEIAEHICTYVAARERLQAELAAAKADLAAAIKQRDDARRWLRDACEEIARIETRFYDALTPQQIAERNGWNCYTQEGGGA